MNEQDHITLQLIRHAVADLQEADRVKVQRVAALLREAVQQAGNHGLMALALVGAEMETATV